MALAPIHINFALAHFCSSDPESYVAAPTWDSPAGREVREWLSREWLIDNSERATPRLEAWIAHLCSQPLPEQHVELVEQVTWAVPKPNAFAGEEWT